MDRSPIILDSDPGLDDAVALQYLLGTGLWDLKAFTAVAGNVPLDHTYRNARALARALRIDGDVPVHRGVGRTFSRISPDSGGFHGENGLGDEIIPDSTAPHQTESAVQAILRLSKQYEGELTLVATGPLTNVAAALIEDPALAHRLKKLVFMGGAVRTGNITPVAEFNVWADPEATDIVVSSGAPYTMVGLDATHAWRFTQGDLDTLVEAGPGMELTANLMRHYLKSYDTNAGEPDCPLHDPLAVGVAADESFVTAAEGTVVVECGSELTRGQTVFLPAGEARTYAYSDTIKDRARHTGRVALGKGPRNFSAHFTETLLRWPSAIG
ncbi:nucleoside hydrolase [Streptomyces sp. NBC_01465]|uniref:nucleoside hydrolase n=1 Tax=Streptomyces sp. NBC_01465 TaxID=2903878 RepID=UPI002E32B3BE|nr:nucleoside hydrolase [Streptomyces sp. NBC_01465]